MTENTVISVTVSQDTRSAIEDLLVKSKLTERLRREGVVIPNISQLIRLSIANLCLSDISQIKKSIQYSVSDETLLRILKRTSEIKV